MNLLIDIRTSSLSDMVSVHAALSWAHIWKRLYPHSQLRLLTYEGTPIESDLDTIYIPRGWGISPKKQVASHAFGPERIISFSRQPSFDDHIPTILHIEDLSRELFPPEGEGFIRGHMKKNAYKKLLSKAHHIIIPEREIGSILSELYGVSESKMSVIPYIIPEDKQVHESIPLLSYGISSKYFIAEGTAGDEWNPVKLLEAFSIFTQKFSAEGQLVILGDIGNHFTNLIPTIRREGLLDRIKFVGTLTYGERKSLYKDASGWIYIGSYYSRGAAVSLAHSYDLPLYLSDVAGLREYEGMYVHPNRTEKLAEYLAKPYEKMKTIGSPNNELIMQVYRKIIAE